MTHDLAWAEQVKSEYKELLGRITRLHVFLNSKPKISVQDISLLKEQDARKRLVHMQAWKGKEP